MLRRLAALTIVFLISLLCVAPATSFGAPGDDEAQTPTGDLRLGLGQLGATPSLTLPGQNASLSLSLAVPDGSAPAALTGTVSTPAYVTGGDIDVVQGDRLLSRTPIRSGARIPISLPLTGIVVDAGTHSIDLALRSHLRTDEFCVFEPRDALRIDNAQVTFVGTPALPRSVSDFLPAALTGVTFYVPSDPTPAEGAAAVSLSAAIVAHYGSAAPARIETRALARSEAMTPPPATGPLDRRIVIAENLPDGLALADGGRYLTLGGSGVANEAAFLTSGLAPLAMASKAIPGSPVKAPQLARTVVDLADLGVGDQFVSAFGWPSVSIGIDQTRIGRPVHDVRIQLIGTYTPPPADSGGQVVVRSGDVVVDSWPADADGAFDRWVQIPDRALHRFTDLTVTLERGDTRSACGDAYRSTLSLSSAGLVQTSAADPPVPGGFESLPQALMPRIQLAWTRGDVPDISRATALMTGLQRLSAAPLGIDLVGMSDVDRQRPAVLIAADGAGLPDMTLPVASGSTPGSLDVKGVDGQPAVINEPVTAFGSLQVVAPAEGTASALVATSTGAPELLDAVLAWLNADPSRWSSLQGSAVLQARDSSPVFYTSPTVPAPAKTMNTGAVVGLVIGLIVVLAAVGLAIQWMLSRRRTGPATEDQ